MVTGPNLFYVLGETRSSVPPVATGGWLSMWAPRCVTTRKGKGKGKETEGYAKI